jgi:hypothetical protein
MLTSNSMRLVYFIFVVVAVTTVPVPPATADLRHPRLTEAQKKEIDRKFGAGTSAAQEAMWKQCELLSLVVKSFFAAVDGGNYDEAFDQMEASRRFNDTKDPEYRKAVARFTEMANVHPSLSRGLTRDFFNVGIDEHRKGAGTVHAIIKTTSGAQVVDFYVVEVPHGWKIATIIFDQYPAFELAGR